MESNNTRIVVGTILIIFGIVLLIVLGNRMNLFVGQEVIVFFGTISLILFLLLVVIAIREIVMWYWKINRIVEQLEEQNKYLKDILVSIEKNSKNK